MEILSKLPSISDDFIFQVGWLVVSFTSLYFVTRSCSLSCSHMRSEGNNWGERKLNLYLVTFWDQNWKPKRKLNTFFLEWKYLQQRFPLSLSTFKILNVNSSGSSGIWRKIFLPSDLLDDKSLQNIEKQIQRTVNMLSFEFPHFEFCFFIYIFKMFICIGNIVLK